ncbi:MAG: ribosome assembly cofactor RimP [Hyphomicrobiales bacterium]
MIDKLKIMELVQEHLDKHSDKFLVSLIVKSGNIIHLFIDGDNGITVQDCIDLSRHVEGNLDRDQEDFELKVSSSGLDMPLKLNRQYRKNIEQDITVNLFEDKPVTGTLKSVTEEEIELERSLSKKEIKENITPKVVIPFSKIKESKVVIKFK